MKAGWNMIWMFSLCCAVTMRAQQMPEYDVRYIGFREGLTDRTVRAICHDHEGFIWIGTQTGLFRYDGFEMLPIELPVPGDSSGLKRPVVMISSICEDYYNRLWFATHLGLFMLPPDRNYARLVLPDAFSQLIPERDYLLVANNKMLRRLRLPLDDKARPTVETPWFARSLKFVNIFLGNDNSYFLSSDSAETKQIRNDTILRRYLGIPEYYSSNRCNLPGQAVFVRGVGETELYRLNVQTMRFNVESCYQVNNAENPYYFSDIARQFCEVNPLQIPPEVAQSVITGSTCWETDAHGRVWLGTAYGLFVFSSRTSQFGHLPFLRGMSCRAILKDGDNLWVSGAWLFKGHMQRQKAQVFPLLTSRAVLQLDHEWLLFAGEYDGFQLFNLKKGEKKHIETQHKHHCSNLLRLRNGKIWSYRSKNMYQFDPEKKQTHIIADFFNTGFVLTLVEDQRGTIWIPSEVNLTKVERTPDGHYLRNHILLNGAFSDALLCGDSLWIGTRGVGLLCFDTKNERVLATYSTADGLPNNFINCLLPDGAGNIWLSTNEGLSCFNPQERSFINFSRKDGLEMDEYNMCSKFRDPATGHLFFGGLNGVTHFDPALVRKSLAPPKVLISKIVRMSEKAGKLLSLLPNNDSLPVLELASGDRYIEFQLTTSDLGAALESKFVYRLDGLDQDWTQTGKNNIVRFALLPAGSYVFRAKCVSPTGILSPEVAINVRVAQVFYKEWWFIAGVFAVMALLVWVGVQQRINNVKDIYNIRKRISDDLHDDVASSLNYLSILIKSLRIKAQKGMYNAPAMKTEDNPHDLDEQLRHFEQVNDEMIEKISDIVWAIDERSQTLGNLVERIQDYAEDLLLQNDVPLKFDVQLTQPNKTLTVLVRQHVLLIFKEAVNNIIRHTKSYQVNIRIENLANQLSLKCENYYSEQKKPQFSTGKGLASMRKRAEMLHSRFEIEQKEGYFCIKVIIPQIFD